MHTEHKDGLPSVTQILGIVDKPFLRIWYGSLGTKECERIKREAGEFGQHIHDQIESLLKNAGSETTGRASDIINKFQQWRCQSGYTPTEIERKVEHKGLGYHGTLDSIGHFGDPKELFVLDWKTSSKIDNLYGCQLAAYAEAYYEETGIRIVNGGVVRLEKDPKKPKQLEVKTFNNLPEYFEVFKACKVVYDFVHPRKN